MNSDCCRILAAAEWDKKEIIWRDKPFYESRYRAFFHVPVNIGKKIAEGMKKISEAGLAAESMVLVKNEGLFGADILIPIAKKTNIFETELITGKFLTRIFEGHYGDMRRWIKETKKYCREKGFSPKEFIFWYAICPKCAKKYGDKVQVVVFARIG